MSAQNCFQRTKPTSFSFDFNAYGFVASFSGAVNVGITDRELACTNWLSAAVTRLQAAGDPMLLVRSTIPRRALPPKYPYPRVGYGNGYRYAEYVEFGADQTTLIVRYLVSPTSEEIAWPTTLPSLLVSRTGSPQVETIAPESWAGQTIYARLEIINGAKTITNFIPTYLGSGAILYPSAPNDPHPSNLTLPRLFPSKTAFTNAFAQNGLMDRPCSACDLCRLDAATAYIPDSLWTFETPTPFSSITWEHNGDTHDALGFAIAALNTNPNSPACPPDAYTANSITLVEDTGGGPPSISIYGSNTPLKIGNNIFENVIDPTDIVNVSIGLTYD